jgi:hypothetical protein
MRNEAELTIVMDLAIVVMMKGREYSADRDHPGDDGGGKDAEKLWMSKDWHDYATSPS